MTKVRLRALLVEKLSLLGVLESKLTTAQDALKVSRQRYMNARPVYLNDMDISSDLLHRLNADCKTQREQVETLTANVEVLKSEISEIKEQLRMFSVGYKLRSFIKVS